MTAELLFERNDRLENFSRRLEQRVDRHLRAKRIPGREAVRLQATFGTVVVRGQVSSPEEKARLSECCRQVAGAFNVIDLLEVAPPN